ncbi:MAG TPA: glycosyltransferase [Clostridiales bacterium]|nr:glycosyltransferase [Clostridiales bacterium]
MDLIYVSYNSEKWIDKCFSSIMRSEYDLKAVSIYVIDNKSTDNSLKKLKENRSAYKNDLKDFVIIEAKENLGFGKANNLGFKQGKDDIACFFNIDTELYPDTLKNLERDIIESDEMIALWELRQFPYEHPKMYDPLTHETTWCSGAAFAIRRDIFEQIHGFDDAIFMYAEDVDLSWRIRSFGYKLKYVPNAVIMHYSYQEAGEIKPNQYVNSIINNILLRYRFGGIRTILKGYLFFWGCLLRPPVFVNSKKVLIKAFIRHFWKIPHFLRGKYCGSQKRIVPCFTGFDYAPIRDGAFYINEFSEQQPLVSVIVRTCGRPEVLRETLISLKNQTYPNIEVIVVEDGQEVAEYMIKNDFKDLNIRYYATGKKVGRSKAGNIAMEMASGKYLNFLDDDDLFYAEHIEVLVKTLEKSKNKAAYAFAFETPIEIHSKEPYVYTIYNYYGVHKQKFDKIKLCYHNYIPIQTIMFEKSLFENYGGLDESLEALEDWDLWVRYSLHTEFDCVEKTTSIYRVPRNKSVNNKRQKELDNALTVVRNKHKSYMQTVSVYDVAMMYQNQM